MKNLLTYAVFLTFFFFIGCNDEENSKPPAKVNVEGRVEKGPFVNNSVVTIQELSESLTPTGRTFQTNIKSDDGTFILNDIELESSYVLLTANGYFFNEVQGKLSSAPLTLHALADLNNGTSVNVNLLSHLKKERLTTLMKNESLSYDKANQQAQTELLSNFGLQKYVQKEVSSISITDVSDEAAALIVISSTLLSLYDNSEARLTEGLTKLSDELKENGTFSATNKEKILEESTSLDWDKITDNIIDRYEELGKEVNIQDLYEYIDWDGDGIAGNESDPSGERYLYFERDTLFIPQEGGTFKVQIESSVRYGYPKGPTDNIHEEPFYDLGVRDINWEDTLEDGYLEVKVSPASAFMIKCGSVIIESADRKLSATLVLKQEGDRDRLFPTEKVRQTYESILSRFYLSYSSNSTMEALYTGYNNSIDEWGWHEFADRTLNSSNSIIHEGYSSNYSAATNLYLVRKVLDQYVSKETEAIKSTFDCLFALSYYPLGILWENVVYAETPDDIESTLRAPQINFKELFTTFEPDMYKAMHVLPALQEGMIVISKNVPRGILGKMYIQTGEYVKAFEQFTAIIESGQYALEADVKQAYSNSSKEFIYSFPNSQMQPYYTFIHATEQVPVITYTEVLLSAAECALKVGNSAQAQQYVEEVIRRKSNSGIILQIKNSKDLEPIWKEYLGGTFTYFAFLKRNGLAEDVLDIESFRTLFPIPFIELTVNPNILQNPGY